MTSRNDISSWFDSGIQLGATHMIVVCDTYDYDDYPVYVKADPDFPEDREIDRSGWPLIAESARHVVTLFDGPNMQKVMECYDLNMSKAEQMEERRAFHY